MHVQEAIQLIGGKKRYHVLVLTILALNFMFVSLHIFSDLFLRLQPKHHCLIPENGTKQQWIPYSAEKGKYYSCLIYSKALSDKYLRSHYPGFYSTKGNYSDEDDDDLDDDDDFSGGKLKKLMCDTLHYDDQHGHTMITEWGLSCKKDTRLIASTVICVAMILGGILFSPFLDKLGRKTLFMMCFVQNTLLSIGVCFIGDFSSYLVLRFLSRLYIEGVEAALLVWSVELVPAENRPLAPFVLFVAYSLGHCVLPVMAYFIKNWRYFQLLIAISSALMIPITSVLVPESLSWLVTANRCSEVEKIIRGAAKFNGILLPANFCIDATVATEDGGKAKDNGATRLQQRNAGMGGRTRQGAGDFMQHELHAHLGHWSQLAKMLANRELRKHFAIVSYIWAVVGFVYYGLTTSTLESKGNVYLNYGLTSCVLIPASISVFLLLRRYGRKKPITFMLIGCGLSVIGSSLCPLHTSDGTDLYPLYVFLKMLAKYTTFSAFISIRLLIIEIFPTPVRGSLVGLTAFFGLLGSGLGYYFSVMMSFSMYCGLVIGVLVLVAAALCRLLPETSNRPLPDTINDVMEAYKDVFVNMISMMGRMGSGRGTAGTTTTPSAPGQNLVENGEQGLTMLKGETSKNSPAANNKIMTAASEQKSTHRPHHRSTFPSSAGRFRNKTPSQADLFSSNV